VSQLDSQIEMIINELGVKVEEKEHLDADGHYIACMNTIAIKANLSEHRRRKTLLHELGHATKHHNNYRLYNLAFALHSKMENEAEEFMIEKMIEARFNDPEFDPSAFNVINFLESHQIDLNYEHVVKEFMLRYSPSVEKSYVFF
jgi:Zn-dependent peptidase ImmA (M78 family)